jgi:serine/threonine-protein kinase
VREVGDKIGARYEIVGPVGERPLGVLYRAIDLEIGVDVALRVIAPKLLPDAAQRQAFVSRLQRGKAITHANLARLYDVALDGNEVVVATQWVPGPTLAERIAKGPLPAAEARAILKQAAGAVAHAHRLGVVLGDLRAETVVVLESAVKLSNVGVGPSLPRSHYLEAMRETPAWPRLAPEIRNGGPAEPRADVYALALLAVEMLTAKLPGTPLTLPGAPPALATVLSRSLSVDPLLRHASADALLSDVEAAFSSGVVVQRTPAARDSALTPLLPKLSSSPASLSDSGELATSELPRMRSAHDDEATRPGDSLAAVALPSQSPSNEQTRQVSPEELDRLRGAEVTRQVPIEDIFPLRVQSTETQQIELDMIVPDKSAPEEIEEDLELEATPAADGTVRTPFPGPPKPPNGEPDGDVEELKTSEVLLLEPDAAKTIPVPRLEEDIPTPPPGAFPVETTTPMLKRSSVADDTLTPPPPGEPVDTLTPLPPPAPAPPSSPQAEDFGDDSLKTNQVPRLDSDKVPTKSNDLPPRARELVVPDRPSPRPVTILPKIEVQIPVEARPPFPDLPPPPPATLPMRPPRRTQEVPALRPPRSSSRWIVILLLGFFGAASGIVITVVHHMQDLQRQRDRLEKQRLADELRARAEALRHPAGESTPSKPPSKSTSAAAAPVTARAPVVTSAGPCPLGANLVRAQTPYCIDVYEYPGGKTIPRTSVSFEEAQKLCASRNERLCSDVEWEHACRGRGGASYPYGAAFDPERCNTGSSEIAPAGEYKECRSGSGAYDMSGNVAEWVTSRGQPAQKGGAAGGSNPSHWSRCSNTLHPSGSDGAIFVGFRCCSEPQASSP